MTSREAIEPIPAAVTAAKSEPKIPAVPARKPAASPATTPAESRENALPVFEAPDRAPRSLGLLERWRHGLSLEELLAGQIFLKTGVAIVVLGVAFFLGYALKELGPPWRVAIGYLGGLAMLAGGLYAERREGYRTLGRALLAGAWAILYFVTFAMHFLPAAQIITSRPVGVFALLLAGGATVAFSLRYRSEWTTLASFLLIFLTLFIAAVELDALFNLTATLVVAAAIAALAWRLRWHRLLGLGAPATWAAFAVWLIPHTLALPAGAASWWVLGGLGVAWLALQGPVLARRDSGHGTEPWYAAACLANLAGVILATFWLHATAPGAAWVAPLVYGLLYLGIGRHLARGGHRPLYLLSATAAVLLLALAPTLYLGPDSRWLTLFWVLETELVLAAGVFLRERYFRWLSYAGFLVVTTDLLAARLSPLLPGGVDAAAAVRLPLLAATVLVGLVNVYLLRRPWRSALSPRETPAVPYGFSILASGLLLILLWQEIAGLWLAPVLAALALLWAAAATRFGLRDFLWEAGGWTSATLATLAARNLEVPADTLTLSSSLGPLAVSAAALVPAYGLLRRSGAGKPHLPAGWLPWFAGFFSAATTLLMLLLIADLPPLLDPWKALFLLTLGTLGLALSLRSGWKDLFAEGCVVTAVGLLTVLLLTLPLTGTLAGVSLCTLSLLASLVPLYAAYLMLRRTQSERLPAAWIFPTASAHSAAATLILILLVFQVVAPPWQAVSLLSLGVLHLALALRSRRGELFAEGCALELVGLAAVIVVGWQLPGLLLGLPARTLSVLAALVPLYLTEVVLRRWAGRAGRGKGDEKIFRHIGGADLALLATVTLTAASIAAAALVKAEALVFDKNLFVALVWGLLGVLYLEIARLRASRVWHFHGHALLAAGVVHLFLVNFLQPGSLGWMSWRLLTVLPFFALMAWVYLGWRSATARLILPRRAEDMRHAYLYGMVAVLAALLLYELPRSWVTPGWAALAAAVVLLWRFTGNIHWRLAGTVLAVASAVRGFGVNLQLRDEILGQRLNLTVLPLACAFLLAGYLVIRLHELGAGSDPQAVGEAGWRQRLAERVRWVWLFSLLGLVNAFLWVEASGTALTLWWSLEGLALVALGFLMRERIARQLGLVALSFCVLKLFLFDLRGLEGLIRVLSFIVLGLVLIAVSFAYTRFRERWKEIW